MARRTCGRALAVGLSISIVGACTVVGERTPDPTPLIQTSAARSASPVRAATPAPTPVGRQPTAALRILSWRSPATLNPHLAVGASDLAAARLVLEPLASFGPDGLPVANGLAAEIPTVANGGVTRDLRMVTWKLRTGVAWSDGTPFSAEDVAFTFRYQCAPETKATTNALCSGVDSVVALDPSTVVVRYKVAQPFFYQWGVGESSLILQREQFEHCLAPARSCDADTKPVGTGPFVVRRFDRGGGVDYERNERFRDPTKPFFASVQLKGGGDAAAAARAVFQTGEADYAWDLLIEPQLLRSLAAAAETKGSLVLIHGSSVERVSLNRADPSEGLGERRSEPGTTHPFLHDRAVRRALALATDRTTIAAELYADGIAGTPTCNVVHGADPMTSRAQTELCRSDATAAERELENAGWVRGADGIRAKGGVRLEALLQTTQNPTRARIADLLKRAWESIGIRVTVKAVDVGRFFTPSSAESAYRFYADIQILAGASDPDPTSYLSNWTCAQANRREANWTLGGWERFCDRDYDAIVGQLATEADQNERDRLAVKANDLLIRDVVVIPLVRRTAVMAGISRTLKGVRPSSWDSEMYNVADWRR